MAKDIDIDEIQKGINEYMSRKYGEKFKITAFGAFPKGGKAEG